MVEHCVPRLDGRRLTAVYPGNACRKRRLAPTSPHKKTPVVTDRAMVRAVALPYVTTEPQTLPSHRATRCLISAADLGVIPRSTGEQ